MFPIINCKVLARRKKKFQQKKYYNLLLLFIIGAAEHGGVIQWHPNAAGSSVISRTGANTNKAKVAEACCEHESGGGNKYGNKKPVFTIVIDPEKSKVSSCYGFRSV